MTTLGEFVVHQIQRVGKDRIIHDIESEGDAGAVVLTQSRKDWAAELGLTHEALYRSLKQMSDSGVLILDGPRISVRAR